MFKMKIPLIQPDLPSFEAIQGSFREALESGQVTNFGTYVSQFEEKAAAYLGSHVATVSSGTMGLILTLQALGIERGQKVIVPSFSFMATAQAVLYAGGVPIFGEIGENFTLSTDDLEKLLKVHPDVFAVVPVHMYGLPCDVEALEEVVRKADRKSSRPVRLLYDAAHAFGSSVKGRRVGSFGDSEVFSLSVTKALVCVEGGLISSRDPELIQRIRRMRNYGIESNYEAHRPGLNGKMSEFHAIIGIHNLVRLDEILRVRAQKAAFYAGHIEGKTRFRVAMPRSEGITHTFKDFTIVVPKELKQKRDAVIRFLAERGVETRAYFCPPIHEQQFFRQFADRALPVTEDLARRVITLPFFTSISEDQMNTVAHCLQEAERMFA